MPLLSKHVADDKGVFVYYGSRTALPTRVRAFIDFTSEHLNDSTDSVVSEEELAAAEASGRKIVRSR